MDVPVTIRLLNAMRIIRPRYGTSIRYVHVIYHVINDIGSP